MVSRLSEPERFCLIVNRFAVQDYLNAVRIVKRLVELGVTIPEKDRREISRVEGCREQNELLIRFLLAKGSSDDFRIFLQVVRDQNPREYRKLTDFLRKYNYNVDSADTAMGVNAPPRQKAGELTLHAQVHDSSVLSPQKWAHNVEKRVGNPDERVIAELKELISQISDRLDNLSRRVDNMQLAPSGGDAPPLCQTETFVTEAAKRADELRAARAEIMELREENGALRRALAEQESKLEATERQLAQLQGAFDTLKVECGSLRQRCDDMQTNMETMMTWMQDMNSSHSLRYRGTPRASMAVNADDTDAMDLGATVDAKQRNVMFEK